MAHTSLPDWLRKFDLRHRRWWSPASSQWPALRSLIGSENLTFVIVAGGLQVHWNRISIVSMARTSLSDRLQKFDLHHRRWWSPASSQWPALRSLIGFQNLTFIIVVGGLQTRSRFVGIVSASSRWPTLCSLIGFKNLTFVIVAGGLQVHWNCISIVSMAHTSLPDWLRKFDLHHRRWWSPGSLESSQHRLNGPTLRSLIGFKNLTFIIVVGGLQVRWNRLSIISMAHTLLSDWLQKFDLRHRRWWSPGSLESYQHHLNGPHFAL
ncbi:hypothetical protein F5879DRAFT_995102 [Lentinula edodes]|nr:hypothetical protein F5879DRAFT_995102 [Lentinula edodes]